MEKKKHVSTHLDPADEEALEVVRGVMLTQGMSSTPKLSRGLAVRIMIRFFADLVQSLGRIPSSGEVVSALLAAEEDLAALAEIGPLLADDPALEEAGREVAP